MDHDEYRRLLTNWNESVKFTHIKSGITTPKPCSQYLANIVLNDRLSWTHPWSDLSKIFWKFWFSPRPTKKYKLAWRNQMKKLVWLIC